MQNSEFEYMLSAGKTPEKMHCLCAYKMKEDAIEAATRLAGERIRLYKHIKVTSITDDEVVWTNEELPKKKGVITWHS